MCRILRLESRAMPSGNVTATLAGSVLTFEGDAQDNSVTVTQHENGDIHVIGRGGTTINGERSITFRAADLPSDLSVVANGNDGHDSVFINGLTLDGSLTISGGNGNDHVRILGAELGGLTINGGSGFNRETVIGTTISGTPGDLVVTDEGINIGRFFDVQVGGSTSFDLGDGFHVVTAVRSNFDGEFSLGAEGNAFVQQVHDAIAEHLEDHHSHLGHDHLHLGHDHSHAGHDHSQLVEQIGAALDDLFARFQSGSSFHAGHSHFS